MLTKTTLTVACYAALALHSADAFGMAPSALPATRAMSSASAISPKATGGLKLAARTSRKAGALALRAKEEFAEGAVAGGFSNKGEPPFQIRGFSLGALVLALGVTITVTSFYSYFTNGNSITSLGFVYGLPITLGGFALKYAEINPVPVENDEEFADLWEEKATETMKKIRDDVTRHRYGDDAHLDTTLEKLGLVNPGKKFPQLQKLVLSKEDGGELGMAMVFQSVDTPYKVWADPARMRSYEIFFGPGINSKVTKVSKEERLVSISIITGEAKKGSGALDDETTKISAGGATKLGEAAAPAKETEDKRSMEV